MTLFVVVTTLDIERDIRIVVHGSTAEEEYYPRVFRTSKAKSLARFLRCEWGLLSFKSRLLRVLLLEVDSPDATFQQVNLRFLSIRSSISKVDPYKLPSSVSLLWNVQTLIFNENTYEKVVAPSEIWEMPQLRHLKFHLIFLPDPSPSDKQDDFVLRNLQTLKRVLNFRCSEEVCKRMPNIKKLHIHYGDFLGKDKTSLSNYCLYNVGRLNKLESLHYFFDEVPNRDDLLQNLTFPSSLKKLVLYECGLHWSDLTIIGSLPHLEVLKLGTRSVTGPEWNPVEGEFLRLKFLGIYWCNGLIYWNADSSHFPVLEKLVLSAMRELDEIPSGIGDIPTLGVIYLTFCRVSTVISAIKILKEQESLGNEGLQVQVKDWKTTDEPNFREQVEIEGLTCHNFRIIH